MHSEKSYDQESVRFLPSRSLMDPERNDVENLKNLNLNTALLVVFGPYYVCFFVSKSLFYHPDVILENGRDCKEI